MRPGWTRIWTWDSVLKLEHPSHTIFLLTGGWNCCRPALPCPLPLCTGGVSRGTDLRGDTEHPDLRDPTGTGQGPPGSNRWGGGWGQWPPPCRWRRRWAGASCPTYSCPKTHHAWRTPSWAPGSFQRLILPHSLCLHYSAHSVPKGALFPPFDLSLQGLSSFLSYPSLLFSLFFPPLLFFLDFIT